MDNEKKPGFFGKIGALWKSGAKGKSICIVGVLAILWAIGLCGDDKGDGKESSVSGGGGDWKYTGKNFSEVFKGFAKDEGEIYWNGGGVKVMQATKEGNLAQYHSAYRHSDRVVWVETQRRYEDGEPLDTGYYIRRGSIDYETAFGAEKHAARYVEVTGNLLAKVKKQIADEKAAAEAKAKAEAKAEAERQAAEAKAKAEREAAIAKAKAEREAAIAKAEAERQAAVAKAKAQIAAMSAGKSAGETTTIMLPGGVTMEMVWCPPGTFMMGYDGSQHQVTLTKGFWMAKTEVTQAQWKSVMGNNPSDNKGDDLPVENVSWNECQFFCKNTGLQLPTEAQWEYACRAGSTGKYAGTGNLGDMGWYHDNSGSKTHPVGTKQPNAWGLCDMHGNVREWCEDWYDDYPRGAVTDPQGSSSGSIRVVRGGSWYNAAVYCTSSRRIFNDPSDASSGLGFRLVRTLSE